MVKQNFEVSEYSFRSFEEVEENSHLVKDYEFKPLDFAQKNRKSPDFEKKIKLERIHAKENQFKVNPIVEKFRGLRDQEDEEYEARVQEEVKKRLEVIQEDAFKHGFEEGIVQGREEIYNEMRNVVDQKLENFAEMVTDVLKTQEEIVFNQRQEIYHLVKNLTKWIILKELKDDGKYIERLLEKLLLEIQTRNNLLIQVNADRFKDMPEVLEYVQKRLGELKNVRVEVDSLITSSGLVVESENGIINATMEEQFKNLDKLFEDVIVEPTELKG